MVSNLFHDVLAAMGPFKCYVKLWGMGGVRFGLFYYFLALRGPRLNVCGPTLISVMRRWVVSNFQRMAPMQLELGNQLTL